MSDKTNWKKKHPLLGADLESELVPIYKSAAMRLAYLALDRPDVAFISKELCRAVSRPTTNAWEHLKHVTRYQLKAPRLQWVFMRQDPVSRLDGLSDSDWAGCPVTRRSTSSSVMRHGRHTLQVAASTQATVALSSGEAEFYAAVRTACRALGCAALARDMGVQLTARLGTDSSAAKGLASRRGAGGVRHIATPALWLQDAVELKRLDLRKLVGKANPADLGTKVLSGDETRRVLSDLSLRVVAAITSDHLRAEV